MSKPRIREEAWAREVYSGNEGQSFKKFGHEEKKVPRSKVFRTQKRLQCVYMLMGGHKQETAMCLHVDGRAQASQTGCHPHGIQAVGGHLV